MAEQVKDCKGNCSCNFLSTHCILKTHQQRNIQPGNIFFRSERCCQTNRIFTVHIHPLSETHAVVDYLGGTAELTEKLDVHSFGSFLLELLTGRRLGHLAQTAIDVGAGLEENIKKHLAINEIVKPAILAGGGAGVEQQVQALLHLALICREQDPEIRPNMVDVTEDLRNIERIIP